MSAPLLEIEDLRVELGAGKHPVHVLRGVDLALAPGEATGLVGESGSGKTTLLLAVLGLLPYHSKVLAGSVRFEARELLTRGRRDFRGVRGSQIACIFQNARASLYPLIPVGRQIARVHRRHHGGSKAAALERSVEMLASVGLRNAAEAATRYPHQLSGGQCQRVMIAMALIAQPKLILADEPTSGLDVTVQRRVLETLVERVSEFGVTMLLVSHDIGVISSTCTRIAVMYAGEIVEEGSREAVLAQPAHPYTQGLLGALESRERRMRYVPGQVPDLRLAMEGCPFVGRCPEAHDACRPARPELIQLASGQRVRCTLYRQRTEPVTVEWREAV